LVFVTYLATSPTNALSGLDFERRPSPTCEKAHFDFPHVPAAASVTGKPSRESQKRSGQSYGIKIGQVAHLSLSDPECAVGELG